MNDEDALKLLREMLENAKGSINNNPAISFGIYSHFIDDLLDTSTHIQNDNFRAWGLQSYLLRTPLRAFFDYAFQNQVLEELKKSLEEEEKFRKEIILNIVSSSLSVGVLSGSERREEISIETLRKDFEENLKGLDEVTRSFVLLKVSNAIREIYALFVDERKKEMLEFSDKLIESSKKGWDESFNTLREYLVGWDKKANMWKRWEV